MGCDSRLCPRGRQDQHQHERIVRTVRQELAKAYQEYNKWKDEANEDEAKMKKLAAAGALAKKVFCIISDNLDVRFRSKVRPRSQCFQWKYPYRWRLPYAVRGAFQGHERKR